jgi:tRNA-modifying protein YgfZ
MAIKKKKIIYELLQDRAVLDINGMDAEEFLQSLITTDIKRLSDKQAQYSFLLSPQGKFLFDFFIFKVGEKYLLDVAAVTIDGLLAKLTFYKLRKRVNMKIVSDKYRVISDSLDSNLLDPRSEKMGSRAIITTDSLGELAADRELVDGMYHSLRIDNMIPEGHFDMIPNKSFPLEFGFEKFNAIAFNKGCFIGQEVITRTWRRGVIRKKLYKISGETSLPPLGTEIFAGSTKIGIVCSSVNSKGLALIKEESYKSSREDSTFLADGQEITISGHRNENI